MKFLSRLHLALPLSPNEKDKLLGLMVKSFNSHLEQSHQHSAAISHYHGVLDTLNDESNLKSVSKKREMLRKSSNPTSIIQELGRGGLMTVMLARESLSNRHTDIKELLVAMQSCNVAEEMVSHNVVQLLVRRNQINEAKIWVKRYLRNWLQTRFSGQLETLLKFRLKAFGYTYARELFDSLVPTMTSLEKENMAFILMRGATILKDSVALEQVLREFPSVMSRAKADVVDVVASVDPWLAFKVLQRRGPQSELIETAIRLAERNQGTELAEHIYRFAQNGASVDQKVRLRALKNAEAADENASSIKLPGRINAHLCT